MKKVFLSIWLCLCLLTGMTSMATAETYEASTDIAANGYYVKLPEGTEQGKGIFLGWKLGDETAGYQQVDVDNDGSDDVTAIFKAGPHPLTVFDTAAYGTTFQAVYLGEEADAPVGGYEYIEPMGTTTEIPIYAKKVDKYTLDTPFVYKVEIEWGDMQFAIGDMTDGLKIWNPKNHTYRWTGEQPGADEYYLVNAETYLGEGKAYAETAITNTEHRTQAHIVMFNHSNAPVDVQVDLSEVAVDTVTMSLIGEADYGISTVETEALEDKGTGTSSYDVIMQAGVVGEIYNTEAANQACAVVKVWPNEEKTPAEGVNTDLFPVTTAVAKLTITLNYVAPEGAIINPNATAADDSQT